MHAPHINCAMQFSCLTKGSTNRKTGFIAVSTTANVTCPESCGMKEGCYGKDFLTKIHWDKVSSGERGRSPEEFIGDIKALEPFWFFRHNIAGDLWNYEGEILAAYFADLVRAVSHLPRKWTYTHLLLTPHNAHMLKWSNKEGFTVNLSTESKSTAAALFKEGWPVCCVTEKGLKPSYKRRGVQFKQCPQSLPNSTIQCSTCGNGSPLCARADRKFVITFPAHGTRKKAAAMACSD